MSLELFSEASIIINDQSRIIIHQQHQHRAASSLNQSILNLKQFPDQKESAEAIGATHPAAETLGENTSVVRGYSLSCDVHGPVGLFVS